MIEKLSIEGFKCFDNAQITLRKLSLFTGSNSSGKSSAILALRLLLDNLRPDVPDSMPQMIKSSDNRIGRFVELRNFITNSHEFTLSARISGTEQTLIFSGGDDSLSSTTFRQLTNCIQVPRLYHLAAMRQSANDMYSINLNPENPIGRNGEFIIDYYYRRRQEIARRQIISNPSSYTIEGQFNLWLKALTGYTIQIELSGSTYSIHYKSPAGKMLRPYHVGTGVSFIASIVMFCLLAHDDDIIVIENPEIHLHPKAQADLLDFFSRIAQSGVQVIIETHSDHCFNGVRRLLAQKHITPSDAAVTFFRTAPSQLSTPTLINMTDNGRMTNYEKGLFDQFDNDLDAILQA